ncbi:MAG: methyl-accepting chemotaxis protein [Planctomycetes bacterium]|nr:methyl-accepting chemotaxis protein [Planctomycetota bacterium]
MRIKTKLILLVITPILGTTALVGVGYDQLGDMRETNRHLAEDKFGTLVQTDLPRLELLYGSIALLLNGDRDAYQVLQAELQAMDGAEGADFEALVSQSASNLDQVHERILKGSESLPPSAISLRDDFEKQYGTWRQLHLSNLEAAKVDLEKALAGVPASLEAFETMRHTIDLMQEAQENGITESLAQVQATQEETQVLATEASASAVSTMRGFLLFGLIIALTAIIGGVALSRTILRPISTLLGRFQDIAEGTGNLTHRVDESSKDEFGELGQAFNTFLKKLETLVGHIRTGSLEISGNTAELTSTSESLANSSIDQAKHLSHIMESTTEVTDMTNKTSKSVEEAAALFERATESIKRGHERTEEMMIAMDEITASSVEIAKISELIDAFAFQTNLLALNGSVEAARAGEAGRGFAIVVDEVRNLSQSSAQASSDAGERVRESTSRTQRGAALAKEVQDLLIEVMDSTTETSKLMREILDSTGIQAERIGEVNQAVHSLDLTVQHNAASAEELAASARTTSSMVSKLDSQVAQFHSAGS